VSDTSGTRAPTPSPSTRCTRPPPWNYGLTPSPRFNLTRVTGPVPDNPFTHDTVPVRITAEARPIAEWIADDEHVVAPLQPDPARSTSPVETVTLVPMGVARLRITAFPTASPDGRPWKPEPPFRRIQNKHSGKVLAVDGMSLENSARVVQFDDNGSADHLWRFL
jgi:hypothetical protein